MAADVSCRQIKSESKSSSSSGLITRDFLGLSFGIESKELDLDLHVPSGWEKRLDLKSGKVFIQRCNPSNSTSDQRNLTNPTPPNLNTTTTTPPQSSSSLPIPSNLKPALNLLQQDTTLDLKLLSYPSPSSYTSVCTLDKVKSALDRAERASTPSSYSSSSTKKRSSSLSNSSSSLSVRETTDDDDERLSSWRTTRSCLSSDQSHNNNNNNGLLVATACPGCLLYVLISKNDPKCPRCNSLVQLPNMEVSKKPKIDLNMSISGGLMG